MPRQPHLVASHFLISVIANGASASLYTTANGTSKLGNDKQGGDTLPSATAILTHDSFLYRRLPALPTPPGAVPPVSQTPPSVVILNPHLS